MLRRQLDFESGEAQARDVNLGVTVNTGYLKELEGLPWWRSG